MLLFQQEMKNNKLSVAGYEKTAKTNWRLYIQTDL